MFTPVIIFAVAAIATALSSMSGGGASVINIPVLLWLGVPFPLATAAQKVSSTFWVLPAAYNYLKGKNVDWAFLLVFGALGLVGVYIGVLIVLQVDQRIMEMAVGSIILALVFHVYLKKEEGLTGRQIRSGLWRSLAYVFAPVLGSYESILGSGNGIMFSIATFHTRGFDFMRALGYYYVVAFPWDVFAAMLLIAKGYSSIPVMMPMVLGGIMGGYFGSKFARYKGNKFIKLMFSAVGSILGLKLIIGI